MDNEKWSVFSLIKLGNRLTLALVVIFNLGLSLLLLSKTLESNHLFSVESVKVINDVGVLFVTITPILFIYELALRRVFTAEMSGEMKKVLNGNFKNEFFNIIEKSMPASYKNILDRGIVDAYDQLDAGHLEERIKKVEPGSEIKIVKMYIPFLNETLKTDIIVDSIVQKGCSYKIVICDPDCEETIANRATAVGYNSHFYAFEITATLEYLQNIWRKLHESGGEKYTSKLEVRAHHYFTAGSLIGFEQYYILGFYLYGDISTQGPQIKVEYGAHIEPSKFFLTLDKHFKKQWEIAYKTVEFSIDKSFKLVDRDTG